MWFPLIGGFNGLRNSGAREDTWTDIIINSKEQTKLIKENHDNQTAITSVNPLIIFI